MFAVSLPFDLATIAAAARPTAFVERPTAFAEVERPVPTTLNGSAAQSTALPARRGGGVRLAVGMAAVIVVAGVMIGVVAHRSADSPAAPAAAPVEAPAEVVPRIRLMIKSKPPGASVVVDGDPIGVTPFSGELDRRDARVELELRLSGYQTATRTITLGDDVIQTITLDRAPDAPDAPAVPGAPGAASGAAPSSPPRPEAVRP